MAFRKYLMVAAALVAVSGLLYGCSDEIATAPDATNEAPILAPTNVIAVTLPNGNVSLSWDGSTQLNVRGHNVYRIDEGSSSIARLNGAEITAHNYLDQTASRGNRYEYRVTSVSTRNTESRFVGVVVLTSPIAGDKHKERDEL